MTKPMEPGDVSELLEPNLFRDLAADLQSMAHGIRAATERLRETTERLRAERAQNEPTPPPDL